MHLSRKIIFILLKIISFKKYVIFFLKISLFHAAMNNILIFLTFMNYEWIFFLIFSHKYKKLAHNYWGEPNHTSHYSITMWQIRNCIIPYNGITMMCCFTVMVRSTSANRNRIIIIHSIQKL